MIELKIINMDDVEVKEVDWLWYPYIPFGKLTIIQGDPGEGKTTAILQISALLSKGKNLPCDDTEREPINIIYQTAEDGLSDTAKPRLMEAGADCSKILVIDETDKSLNMLDERIELALIKTDAKLIILDPVQAYIGNEVNMNSANETRAVMSQLGNLAEKYSCAIVLIGHMNKASGVKSTYRGLGSIDFQAVARSVLVVGRLKDKPQRRVIAQSKSSLAPEGDSIAFELDKATGFSWIGKCDVGIDDLLNGVQKDSKSRVAEKLLVEILSNGKVLQSDIIEQVTQEGISKRVIDEAKKNLNIKSIKQRNKWYWELPEVD